MCVPLLQVEFFIKLYLLLQKKKISSYEQKRIGIGTYFPLLL